MTQTSLDITLNPDQEAVLTALLDWVATQPTSYIAVGGYAGTGKTTLIGVLRAKIAEHFPPIERVAFCAYTGKAAAVLRQKLIERKAIFPKDTCSTIHSLIYKAVTDAEGRIERWDRQSTLNADLIVIDEGSMVNREIWQDLQSYRVPILVFGDHGQLPPIEGTFNLMAEPAVKLEKIVRQAEDNAIIRLSRHVREGGEIPFGDFRSVHKYSVTEPEGWEKFEALMSRNDDDYLCICGRNKTRVGLNQRIRLLHDIESEEPVRGERVICLKNNHTKLIFNGMLGRVTRIAHEGEYWYKATIDMEDRKGPYEGEILRCQFGQQKTLRGDEARKVLPDLPEKGFGDLFDYGYALTVHKAQGSEASRVLVFEERMFGYDDQMWQRWLYTAITRAKDELYIFAQP